MSMTRLLPLSYQVTSDLVLLVSSPHLAQSQMVDLSICSCHFEPPLAESLFHLGRLHLLFKEVNLGRQCLALFVHGLVAVDFSHKTPIVTGELVKCSVDHGESGPTSHQGG